MSTRFAIAPLLGALALWSLADPSLADDSLLFINRINYDKDKADDLKCNVWIDGKKFGSSEFSGSMAPPGVAQPHPLPPCDDESDLTVIDQGPITIGKHLIVFRVEGGKRVAKTMNIRVEDAATNIPGVPSDGRFWCVFATKTSLRLASKDECYRIENDR